MIRFFLHKIRKFEEEILDKTTSNIAVSFFKKIVLILLLNSGEILKISMN